MDGVSDVPAAISNDFAIRIDPFWVAGIARFRAFPEISDVFPFSAKIGENPAPLRLASGWGLWEAARGGSLDRVGSGGWACRWQAFAGKRLGLLVELVAAGAGAQPTTQVSGGGPLEGRGVGIAGDRN